MKKQISRISLHQTAKILSIVLFVFIAIVAIPVGVFLLFSEDRSLAFPFFLAPFIYAAFNYLFWVIWGWMYNLLAKHFGGIEFELRDERLENLAPADHSISDHSISRTE